MRQLMLITMIAILLIPLTVQAQDNPFLPDDEDNECFENGLLDRLDENGCTTEWAWTCGYYLDAWLDNGGWGNENNFFPDWCAPESLLPPKPEMPDDSVDPGDSSSYPAAGCVVYRISGGISLAIDLNGGWFSGPDGMTYYDDSNCQEENEYMPHGGRMVYAPSGWDADTLCKEAFGPDYLVTLEFTLMNDLYTCVSKDMRR